MSTHKEVSSGVGIRLTLESRPDRYLVAPMQDVKESRHLHRMLQVRRTVLRTAGHQWLVARIPTEMVWTVFKWLERGCLAGSRGRPQDNPSQLQFRRSFRFTRALVLGPQGVLDAMRPEGPLGSAACGTQNSRIDRLREWLIRA